MSICYVKDLPDNNYIRSGVIPYRKTSNGNNEFCFGIDRKHNTAGSFSGSPKKNEGVIKAGLREFREESFNVFGVPSIESISNCVAVFDNLQVIIFIPINYDKEQIVYKFNKLVTNVSEMKSLDFYDYESLFNVISGFDNNIFHWKVSRLLMDSIEINGDYMN